MANKNYFDVKEGNVRIRIRHYKTNRGYDEWKFSRTILIDGKKKREIKSFPNREDAKKEAEEIVKSIHTGDIAAISIPQSDRIDYWQAKEFLKPSGKSMSFVAMDWLEATKLLGTIPILKAAQFYVSKNCQCSKTVREVADEYIAFQKERGVSKSHITNLRSLLIGCKQIAGRQLAPSLCSCFNSIISGITSADIQHFLQVRKLNASGHNIYLNRLTGFFSFAKRKGYLPNDWRETEMIGRKSVVSGEPEIYSASELKRLLAIIPDERIRLVLCIWAFVPIRKSEILTLDWSDIHLGTNDGDYINIRTKNAKTRNRRSVDIPENLKAWLLPVRKESGPIWPLKPGSFDGLKYLHLKKSGESWKENAMRHSCVSYMMALSRNEYLVSSQAGHSPAMLHRHYRRLVTAQSAKEWFSIVPTDEAAEKTIYLKTAGVRI
jgi:integrase